MASDLVELINEYYKAKNPYTQMVLEAHAIPASPKPSPETKPSTADSSATVPSHQEQSFSTSPQIPRDEMRNVLRKLEEFKMEHAQGDQSTGQASAKKKKKK